jgi:tetratricopeptide (TPR) repeat protein
LLLMALALWLLMEYNVRQSPRWLDAAAVVWGAGMAESWVMQLTLPLFVGGLIWLLRLRFFQWKVVLRLAALGLAGFSVYVVQPMVNGLAPHSPWTLGEAWLASLRETKYMFELVYYGFWRGHRLLLVAALLYFLVPTLSLLVRLRDEGTRNKSGVDQFQVWIYRSLRVVLLLVCFWLAFDPTVGLRQMVQHQMGIGLPLLTFDYVNALGAAFLVGNLLLISQPVPARDRMDRPYGRESKIPWRQWVPAAAATGIALVAAGLIARNAPAIWRMNFHPAEDFGVLAVKSLPAGGGVVMCDFPERLLVFQAALARQHLASDWLAVDTRELAKAEYRAGLQRRLPAGWLTEKNRHELTPLETLRLLAQVAATNRMFYLHPSYGYYFEAFYLQPTGSIYEMKLRGKDPLDVPPLTGAEVAANESFWTGAWNRDLASLVPPPSGTYGLTGKLAHYGLVPASRAQDLAVAEWYSILLNTWGVALQKAGHLAEANARFEQALELDTNNLSARISLACNTNLQAGVKLGLGEVTKLADQLGNLERLNAVMDRGGPFDEPAMDYLMSRSFQSQGLMVQAAEQLERVHTLAQDAVVPELELADIYNRLRLTGRSRPLIDHLREEMRKMPANSQLDMNLALLDADSWALQTNLANARNVLQTLAEAYPNDPDITTRVMATYVSLGDLTNALQLADAQLAKKPDDPTGLNTKATILLQAGRTTEAIGILDHLLLLTNLPSARLNRALGSLANRDFHQAESDLHELENEGNDSPVINFGFALVAQHSNDTNQALHYLQLCLTNVPAGSPLWEQANAHIRMLQPAAAK